MKGDVEAAQEHARTDRYQGEQPERVEAEAANAAASYYWDEGVVANEAVSEKKKERPTARTSTNTSTSAEKNNGWKDWDEQ